MVGGLEGAGRGLGVESGIHDGGALSDGHHVHDVEVGATDGGCQLVEEELVVGVEDGGVD